MTQFPSALIEILLTTGRTLALQLNDNLAVRVVHNAPLLIQWCGDADVKPTTLQSLLAELLPSPRAGEILQQISAAAAGIDATSIELGTCELRMTQGGGPDRFVEMSLHHTADARGMPLLLLMRDITVSEGLQHSLTRTQQSLDAALAVVRAPPQAIRAFLTRAVAAIGEVRATMKLPAREQEAVHAKLGRLLKDTEQLGADAVDAGIDTIAQACKTFAQSVTALRDQPLVSGDQLLRLAPLLDHVAASVGDCLRIEEQRHNPTGSQAQPAASGGSSGKQKEWARGAERGWNTYLRRIGEELGTLVKLQVQDASLVPPALRRDVDNMLQHLLRNAVEHGIETPEQRLAADKAVSGQITVKFQAMGRGLSMSVRDDGRGFDVGRIGRAAVLSGLLSEESLLEYDPGEIVGLIFKATFSTENLAGEAGRGRGMTYLRRAVARLGGQISVATKPGIYTRFVIELPAAP